MQNGDAIAGGIGSSGLIVIDKIVFSQTLPPLRRAKKPMGDTPYMPLWVADFVNKTAELSAAETGAYLMLILAQWNRKGGSITDDPRKLKRLARCGREWPRVWDAISHYFETDQDGIFNERCREEAQKVAAKREVRAHVGARGGKAKALKYNNAGLAKATILPKQLELESERREKREAKASPKKRGERLPENWVLPMDWGQWASSNGWPEITIREEAEKFRDYWISKSGSGATKLDWLATWRNWMRNTSKQKGNGHDRFDAGRRAAERFEQQKRERAMDSGPGPDSSKPLLSAGPTLRVIGSSDDGLA